jgi:ZIP family zinc transporter
VSALALVFLYSALAVSASALGALPFALRREVPAAWLGWAKALAGGLMFGAAYVLIVEGLELDPSAEALGAVAGIGFVFATHAFWDSGESRAGGERSALVLRPALHAAAEGVAIGVSMVVHLELGVFVALAFATHNVPESAALCGALRGRGMGLLRATLRVLGARAPQAALAVVAFHQTTQAPVLLPWALGFAAGALVYLVLVDLLPASYREAGQTSIALLTSLALGAVVLLESFFRAAH